MNGITTQVLKVQKLYCLAETKSTLYFLENGVLISRLKPNMHFDIHDVMENAEARQNLPVVYPRPLLLDIRKCLDISLHAILATSNQKDLYKFSAIALLLNESVQQQLVARESYRFHHAHIPFRAFTDEHKANNWLRKYSTF